MVPKITSAGRSFKGAARYYLHDKGANTSDRVAFVETRNLDTDDPRRAVARMIDTATHANQLKAVAGIKGGRPLQKPVYTFSLAWHPDETPTRAQQIEAVQEALNALGMADREALIVAHKDTGHPHVHVMVNRVCPTTGRAASNSDDRLKLSRWAEDHDRRHGRDHCPERRRNNAARRAGEWRKDNGPSREAWAAMKRAETANTWQKHREETAEQRPERKAQFEALERQKAQRQATRQAEVKALYRPVWRDVLKRQEQALKDYDAGIVGRLKHAMESHSRPAQWLKAIVGGRGHRQAFLNTQERERAEIGAQQRQTMRDAAREVVKAWKYDRDTLRASHKSEDDRRYQETKAAVRDIWSVSPPTVEQQTTRPTFEEKKDRRKEENSTERQQLEQAPEPEKKRARRKLSEQVKEGRNRSKDRSRSRPRRPR